MVTFADFLGVKGAVGAAGDALVTESFGGDEGDKSEDAGEFVLEDFVFGPGIDAVEDDAFLAGGDEIFDFGDDLADDPIFAFGLANHFAKFAFAIRSDGDIAFLHFFVNHAAKVDFWYATFGEIINSDRFATAAHADDGDDFDIFGTLHGNIIA